jgi:hypothetical protein
MKHLKDGLITLILGAIVIKLAFDMIRPYAPWLIVSLAVGFIGLKVYERKRQW